MDALAEYAQRGYHGLLFDTLLLGQVSTISRGLLAMYRHAEALAAASLQTAFYKLVRAVRSAYAPVPSAEGALPREDDKDASADAERWAQQILKKVSWGYLDHAFLLELGAPEIWRKMLLQSGDDGPKAASALWCQCLGQAYMLCHPPVEVEAGGELAGLSSSSDDVQRLGSELMDMAAELLKVEAQKQEPKQMQEEAKSETGPGAGPSTASPAPAAECASKTKEAIQAGVTKAGAMALMGVCAPPWEERCWVAGELMPRSEPAGWVVSSASRVQALRALFGFLATPLRSDEAPEILESLALPAMLHRAGWALRRLLVAVDPVQADAAVRDLPALGCAGWAREVWAAEGAAAGSATVALLAQLACTFDGLVVCNAGKEEVDADSSVSRRLPPAATLALGQTAKACLLTLQQESAWEPALRGLLDHALQRRWDAEAAYAGAEAERHATLSLFACLTLLGGFVDGMHPGSHVRHLEGGGPFTLARPAGVLARAAAEGEGEAELYFLGGGRRVARAAEVQLDTTLHLPLEGVCDASHVGVLMPTVAASLRTLEAAGGADRGWPELYRAVRVLQMVKAQARASTERGEDAGVGLALAEAGALERMVALAGALWAEPRDTLAGRLTQVCGGVAVGAVGRRGVVDLLEQQGGAGYYGASGRVEGGADSALETVLGALQTTASSLLPPAIRKPQQVVALTGTAPSPEAAAGPLDLLLPPLPEGTGGKRPVGAVNGAAPLTWAQLWNDASTHTSYQTRAAAAAAGNKAVPEDEAAAELEACYVLWSRVCSLAVALE
ncbi:hypothetical protein CYMTET_25553, partial [Cymbomonas tetramitiformis]